jgi:hypothetical protein
MLPSVGVFLVSKLHHCHQHRLLHLLAAADGLLLHHHSVLHGSVNQPVCCIPHPSETGLVTAGSEDLLLRKYTRVVTGPGGTQAAVQGGSSVAEVQGSKVQLFAD